MKQRRNKGTRLIVALACLSLVGLAEAAEPAGDPRFVLELGGKAFDPVAEKQPLPGDWNRSPDLGDGVEDLHLVQFDGPVTRDALEELEARGLEIVQYVHPYSYVVWGRRSERDAAANAGPVRWTGDFSPGFRVLPRLRDLPADPMEVHVLIYRGSDADAVVRTLTVLGGAPGDRRAITEELEVAGFTLPGDRIPVTARVPGVYSIQKAGNEGTTRGEAAGQISAGNLDMSGLAVPGYPAWLTAVGVDGTGVVAALVDTGVDEGHPDVSAQVLPCVGSTCSTTRSAHGTHTAGILAGDATSMELNNAGFLRGLGTAPGAKIFEQDWRTHYALPGGMLELITQSSRNGAVLSNNSWGSNPSAMGYSLRTLLVDAGVRDADPEMPGNQPMIYIQAIENGNGGVSSQGTPDDAKNVFVIGSTRAVADGNGTPSADIDDVSFNSGHGPALDGRTIPHMVAPGCYLDSPVAELPEGFVHEFRCGTSMAAAHVSGAVALFIEYYRALVGSSADPSPALVKAAFMPVAHDLDGALDADLATMGHRPDTKQGWGRMNLSAVVDPADPVLYFDQTTVFDFTGQEWSRVVTQANPAEPMRAMLVWTDAPGHGLGGTTPAWNNNLDLVVEADGQTYLGNDFGLDGLSTTGGFADTMNNAEGVMLATVTGNATIRVDATDINSNGVPHSGDRTDQDFALVCYNCALVPDFALNVDTALGVCAGEQGMLQVGVEQLAGFGDPVTLTAVGVPAGASAGFGANPVAPPATTMLTLDPGTAVDGDYTLEIQGDSTAMTRSVTLGLNLRTAAPVPALPTLPADLAIDVFPRPTLEWGAASWTDRYLIEIATAPDFMNIVYSAVDRGTSHTLDRFLDQQATYYWRLRGTNACGYGAVSSTYSFTTRNVPDLLLVDDDYDLPNEQNEFTQALDNLGVSYDIWDIWAVHFGAEPTALDVAPYDHVIWWSGQEEVFPGPDDESERTVMPDWLDRSGCLLINSLDYVLAQSGVTEFMQERLGVSSVTEDTGMGTVTGQGSVFGGLGPYSLVNLNPDFRDTITPDITAELAFSGDLGDAGINKDGGWYRTAYLGFGIESTGITDKQEILNAFLTWCATLPAADGDGDGVINGDDCIAGDANAWSAPQPIDDLMLGKDAVGFSWSEPMSGSGSRYDVLRSDDVTDFYDASCVFAGGSNTFAPEDPDEPMPGQLFYYLVGAKSECGVSTLGNNLDGTPRYGTACDAETEWW